MDDRARGIQFVLVVTLVLNVAVALSKILYGVWAESLSIRADGFHSATDGLNNVVLLVGTWLAARPPDREHPYGHKKLEVFAAGAVGIGLLVVAADVVRDVIGRVRGTMEPPHINVGAFAVLGGTLAVNVGVSLWEARVGKRLMSPALLSDAAHTRSDVVVTVGVSLSALLVRFGFVWVDAVAGAAVAVFIGITGVRIVKENASYLMDTNLVDVDRVVALALTVEGVRAARDVRSRGSPGNVFVDMAIAVDGGVPVERAHSLAHRVEDSVRKEIPGIAGVQVHVEPA